SGLNQTIAENIVALRDSRGPFKSRRELLDVPRLGEKTFEQAAGFLRIQGADNPLDASAVHPESYQVVEKIVADTGLPVARLINDPAALRRLRPEKYTDERFGLPTVIDIIKELEKPGRDPRPEFKTATFAEGVETLKDLDLGMVLEGTVTNVTHFGAFVDVGVHQDGLVHISAIAEKFVKDPREVVKAGDIVKVKVMEVDIDRKRIALSMRLGDEPGQANSSGGPRRAERSAGRSDRRAPAKQAPAHQREANGTMAALFKQAMEKKR
ncbi:MAG: S1 RNA-binding domain-containing protein, partial [Porticoccaceae bacterium]|nr:S1 RNA-binding domain-containing protein [Porticoccaceae bacterium]